MRVACLIAVLLPLSVSAQSRAAAIACRDVCQQHVTAPDVRARVCGRCFTDTDRGAWALGLTDEPVLRGVLSERDWAVRWGAVRALAKLAAVTEVRQLATIISQSKGADELNACVTAVHVAGVRKVTTGTLLQSGGATGPAAAARCWARRGEITTQLQLQMYRRIAGGSPRGRAARVVVSRAAAGATGARRDERPTGRDRCDFGRAAGRAGACGWSSSREEIDRWCQRCAVGAAAGRSVAARLRGQHRSRAAGPDGGGERRSPRGDRHPV